MSDISYFWLIELWLGSGDLPQAHVGFALSHCLPSFYLLLKTTKIVIEKEVLCGEIRFEDGSAGAVAYFWVHSKTAGSGTFRFFSPETHCRQRRCSQVPVDFHRWCLQIKARCPSCPQKLKCPHHPLIPQPRSSPSLSCSPTPRSPLCSSLRWPRHCPVQISTSSRPRTLR